MHLFHGIFQVSEKKTRLFIFFNFTLKYVNQVTRNKIQNSSFNVPGSEWEHSGDLFSMGISIAKKKYNFQHFKPCLLMLTPTKLKVYLL